MGIKETLREATARRLIEDMLHAIAINVDSMNDEESLADAVNKIGILMKVSKELEGIRKKLADNVIAKMQEMGISCIEDMQIISVDGQTRIDSKKVADYFAKHGIDINLVTTRTAGYKYLSEIKDGKFKKH